MTLSVIIALYISIGLMSAAGSVAVSKKVFSAKAEQIFFGLFLVPIAGFYLAFTAYFGNEAAWRLETGAVAVFAVFGVLGSRAPVVLMLGYVLHGLWDLLHELHAHGGVAFDTSTVTEIPLAYGAFCATYDWCLAVYFYTRRRQWSATWRRAQAQ
ncbi:MAG TPA: DUF6010 family protein [Methylomirabilota bacterium]|nr:DUF6010 family protein [Methylomirabilota bacterium]